MQNKGKLTIMKYFRACVGSFLVISNFSNFTEIFVPNKQFTYKINIDQRYYVDLINNSNNLINEFKFWNVH